MSPSETIAFNCGGDPRFFQSGMRAWIGENPAFEAFVDDYQVKITAKVRACRNEDQLRDLFWELEVAHLLLQSPDFRIAYEPYGTNQSRAPDYRIITTFGATFNVEATRIANSPATLSRFENSQNVEMSTEHDADGDTAMSRFPETLK